MEQRSRLLDLPDELLLQILSYTSYTSRFTQNLTCSRLRALVRDTTLTHDVPRCLDLLLLEQLLDKPSRYACTHCLRLLPRSSFVLSQTRDYPKGYWKVAVLLQSEEKGVQRSDHAFLYNVRAPPVDQGRRRMLAASEEAGLRGLRPSASSYISPAAASATSTTTQQAHPPLSPWAVRSTESVKEGRKPKQPKPPHSERICIDCGVKQHLWSSNHMLRYPLDDEAKELGTGIICKRCNRFATCAPDSRAMLTKRCEQCLQYRPPGTR